MTVDHAVNGSIEGDLPCVKCGYNLRTRPITGDCPECGHPVGLTVVHHKGRGDPRWVRRVLWGVDLLIVGLVAPVVLAVLFGFRDYMVGIFRIVIVLMYALAPVLATVGLWLATSPEPGVQCATRLRVTRWITRISSIGATCVWLSPIAVLLVQGVGGDPTIIMLLLIPGGFFAGMCLICAGVCFRTVLDRAGLTANADFYLYVWAATGIVLISLMLTQLVRSGGIVFWAIVLVIQMVALLFLGVCFFMSLVVIRFSLADNLRGRPLPGKFTA